MRLFIAVLLSDPLRVSLLNAQRSLRVQGASGNFSRPENLHLTLAFLGETEDVSGARAAMEEACAGAEPFWLSLSGGGCFGDLWWAGLAEDGSLAGLARRLSAALCSRGFSLERRSFRPHITLVRELRAPRPVRLEIAPAAMEVQRICLMKSERINGRLTYTQLCAVEL